MDKRYILGGVGIVAVLLLFFLGKTAQPPKPVNEKEMGGGQVFDIHSFIKDSKAKLTPSQNNYLTELENGTKRGDVKDQQLKAYSALADFWKDSVRLFEPYAYYVSEAAKLDNSEKSLTFAGHLLINNMRGESDPARLKWETNAAIELFEKALQQNPGSHDLKIGLGSAYIFGRGKSGDPQQTMEGIQQLLSVVREDSTNMKAQLMLGIGGTLSGQYDKAIERFKKVIAAEPGNIEAIAFLADTYAANGNNPEAIKWYEQSKKIINNPQYSKEVDHRIQELRRQ